VWARTTGPAPGIRPISQPSQPFGKLLRDLREARGIFQAELARRAGVHHTLISRLESGGRRPSREMAVRLARGLAGDDREVMVRLLAAAGYAPIPVDAQLGFVEVWELIALLSDHRLPEPARRLASSVIAGLAEALRAEIDRHIIRGNGSMVHASEGGGE
jgi:transcriptional regulator with XRE-family HTH domain